MFKQPDPPRTTHAPRNKDANTAWTSASDGTLEERIYYCQNWRGDVSALVYANGDQVEQVRYSPYGTSVGLVGGDTDSDGDCNSLDTVDTDQIQTWINGSAYDVRGDLDLNGVINASDKTLALAGYQGLSLGRGKLSSFGSRAGWSGYSRLVATDWCEARNRAASTLLGRWARRDPMEDRDSLGLYAYTDCNPIRYVDPLGLVGSDIFGIAGGVIINHTGSTITVHGSDKDLIHPTGKIGPLAPGASSWACGWGDADNAEVHCWPEGFSGPYKPFWASTDGPEKCTLFCMPDGSAKQCCKSYLFPWDSIKCTNLPLAGTKAADTGDATQIGSSR
jgi:RHS repeat-associated protein